MAEEAFALEPVRRAAQSLRQTNFDRYEPKDGKSFSEEVNGKASACVPAKKT